MMFLVGLMGLMAVGATALYGFDGSVQGDDDQDDMVLGANGTVPEDEVDTAGLKDLLEDPDAEDPAELRLSDEPDTFPEKAQDETGSMGWGDAMNDSLEGTSGVDQLNGYQGDDTVSGLEGGDILHGDAGNDQLYGDAGNDTLHGGAEDDLLWGGEDDDALFGHDDQDTLYGEAGDDSLVGSVGNDELSGGTGNDALHGDLGNDTLFGGWGDDVINGYAGPASDDTDTDYLNGGGGDDMIVAGNGDIVTAGDGADTIALGDWLSQEHQAEILDYTANEDSLMVVYDDIGGPDPDLSLEPDEIDPTRMNIVLNGTRIAAVANAADLTLDQIMLVGQTTFDAQTAA